MARKIGAVFGWRWEPEWLVKECVENLSPLVDVVEVLDNRHQTGEWQDEYRYRIQQREAAHKLGLDWFLLTSPDERWSVGSEKKIRSIVKRNQFQMYSITIREMWSMNEIRVDGAFADRQRMRIFPVRMMKHLSPAGIHNKIVPRKYRRNAIRTDIDVYHLKNSHPDNRRKRAEMMKELDARIGKDRPHVWDGFLDEDILLEPVPEGAFTPPLTRPFLWTPEEY